jgi:hypothetical protein
MPRPLMVAPVFAVLALGAVVSALIAILRRARFGIDA